MVVVPPLNALLFHVQVTLWNTGEDAYQHHLYGDWITIERVIKTAGGTQYKLINSAGKKVGEVVGGGCEGGSHVCSSRLRRHADRAPPQQQQQRRRRRH
jgi:hypothetical protein